MMAISRVYGPRSPTELFDEIKIVNEVPDSKFGSLLEFVESIVIGGRVFTFDSGTSKAKELGISDSLVLSALRIYSALKPVFLTEPSADKFQKELTSLGLSPQKSKQLWTSLSSNRERIELGMNYVLRKRFGPIITSIEWRADNPISGSPPFLREPVGVVTLMVQTGGESRDVRFEVDLATLDNLIENLSELRHGLAEMQPSAQEKEIPSKERNRPGRTR